MFSHSGKVCQIAAFKYNILASCHTNARNNHVDPKKGVPAMFIVHVHVHVKVESIEAFKKATIENARNSVQEPGIARFDVIQQLDDPAKFILIECYRTPSDPTEHKKTAHYAKWRDIVADMMAEPRSSVKYDNLFPDDAGWG
jgi:autoinducer 2-degrading protein